MDEEGYPQTLHRKMIPPLTPVSLTPACTTRQLRKSSGLGAELTSSAMNESLPFL